MAILYLAQLLLVSLYLQSGKVAAEDISTPKTYTVLSFPDDTTFKVLNRDNDLFNLKQINNTQGSISPLETTESTETSQVSGILADDKYSSTPTSQKEAVQDFYESTTEDTFSTTLLSKDNHSSLNSTKAGDLTTTGLPATLNEDSFIEESSQVPDISTEYTLSEEDVHLSFFLRDELSLFEDLETTESSTESTVSSLSVEQDTSTVLDLKEVLDSTSNEPLYKVQANSPLPTNPAVEETSFPTTESSSNNITDDVPRSIDNSATPEPPPTSAECFDGPHFGTCMPYKECSLSGRKAFAICKDGRFCCELDNVSHNTGVAYGCGLRSRSLVREAKVVGGVEASFGEFPWQAYIFFSRGRAFCGGTLISDEWVMTAAHCIYGLKAKRIHVRLGEYDLSHKFEPLGPINRNVKRVYIHPKFNAKGENDIALLQLNAPVEMQPNVIPICLPKASESFTHKMAIVTGWGTTSWNGFTSDILQKASLPIITDEKCKALVEGYHSSFLCAGYIDGTADSCMGDSGGPLQIRDAEGRFHIVGVVSWGEKCAQEGKAGIYTSVAKFLPWITSITKVTPP